MSGLFRRNQTADTADEGAPIAGGDDATAEPTGPGGTPPDAAVTAEQPAAAPNAERVWAAENETAEERAGAEEGRRKWHRRRRVEADAPPPGAPDVSVIGVGLDIPAGTDLDKLVGPAPTTRRRGKLRRRLRHLRSVREVLLRDLGGMVFEVHRAHRDQDQRVQSLVSEKLGRLATVDTELRDLEAVLDDRRGLVVREPGISGTCPNCGELFGSDARFCWACGTPVAPGARRPPEALTSQHHVESTAVQLPPPPLTPPPPPAP